MSIQSITSRSNPLIIETGKLAEKKYRQRMHLFCFEGRKLLGEAIEKNVALERIFVTEQARNTCADFLALLDEKYPDLPVFSVPESVYEKISGENAPQGVFCVAKALDNLIFYNTIYKKRSHFPTIIKEKILVCDGMRDPGNLGTVIRTANALGFDRLVLSSDCADVYNPKVVRAAMGALFRMPLDITDDTPAYLASLREAGYDVRAAALRPDAQPLGSFPVTEDTVFVIGNEGHGLSDAVIDTCSGTVIIPMAEGAESFNAAIAASLLMWERCKVSK
ncbi:MAG: RNA methyltransferase [Clostridia bacterium]|nr:RNA methyltransferase [Clostridia bacterium]